MLRRLLVRVRVCPIALLVFILLFGPTISRGQDKVQSVAQPVLSGDEANSQNNGPDKPAPLDAAKHPAEIDRMFSIYDLRPHPLPSIPDNPPPHEGAMITDRPYVIEPPDLILVEVLEAMPGRPISGERLVRPDGTISLGFYGDVRVAGLTREQAKVAIIKHLRKYVTDQTLGLESSDEEKESLELTPEQMPAEEKPTPPSAAPVKPRSSSLPTPAVPRSPRITPTSSGKNRRDGRIRLVRWQEAGEPNDQKANLKAVRVPINGPGQITITIDVSGQAPPANQPGEPVAPPPMAVENPGQRSLTAPQDSDRVFVDITAYNSTYYYAQGDFLVPGRLPWTGKETVLDGVTFAGGFVPTADPKDLKLIRPGTGGKPAKIYKVDLVAIQERGDVTTNYQIFPGDRLIAGRNEVVKKTAEIDRLVAPLQAMAGFILQEAFMLRALQFATAEDRNQLLKEYVDFFAKELSQPGGVQLDEQSLREAFTRRMKLPPNATAPAPAIGPSPR